jgi:Tol biopolymer transport system component
MGSTKTTLSVWGVAASLLLSTNLHAATNGRNIAFPCRDHFGSQNICYYDVITQQITQMTFRPSNGLPWWSPNGKVLAYTYQPPARPGVPPRAFIFVMNADGSGQRSITEGAAPAWSPDGQQIAFTSGKTGTAEVWLMRPDGSRQTLLTNAPGFNKVTPTWSPDGKSIAYTQFDANGQHPSIWVITA